MGTATSYCEQCNERFATTDGSARTRRCPGCQPQADTAMQPAVLVPTPVHTIRPRTTRRLLRLLLRR